MNEEQLRQMLNELLDQREKGLVTKADLIKGLSEKVGDILKANFGDIDQLKKNLKTLSDEIQSIRGGVKECNVDQLDGLYKGCWKSPRLAQDFGLYVMSSVMKSQKAADILKARGYSVEKAAATNDDVSGGLFVPSQIIDGFIMLVGEYGIARRDCMVYPMSTDPAMAFKLDTGLTVYCTSEGASPTAQDMKSRMLALTSKEWNVYCAVDRTLDEDSALMIGNIVGELMAMALAEKEDDVLFNGDGTSPYFGFRGIKGWLTSLTSPKGLVSGSGSAWTSLTIKDHRKLMGVLHSNAWKGGGPKWYCSPQYYFEVMMGLADSAGGATQTEIILSEAVGKRRFLGIPVEFAPLPTATASGVVQCVLGNLKRGALLGDRRKTTIEQSREALFLERQIAILGTERVSINVYGCHDVTTDSVTRAGTIVGLKTT